MLAETGRQAAQEDISVTARQPQSQKQVEYDGLRCRHPSSSLLLLVDVGIQTGESHLSPSLLLPLSLSCRPDSWASPSRHIPLHLSCELGVNATKIVAIYLNGCLMSGESTSIHTASPGSKLVSHAAHNRDRVCVNAFRLADRSARESALYGIAYDRTLALANHEETQNSGWNHVSRQQLPEAIQGLVVYQLVCAHGAGTDSHVSRALRKMRQAHSPAHHGDDTGLLRTFSETCLECS